MASSLYRQLPHSEASAVYAVYRKNCEAGMYQHLRLNEAVYARATELAGMLAGPFGLRSLDTLHLATALVAGVETMATFDQRLARAAKAAGMKLLR